MQISAYLKNVEVVLCDGTFVDDDSYFQTLPSQTILVLRKPGEKVVDGEFLHCIIVYRRVTGV